MPPEFTVGKKSNVDTIELLLDLKAALTSDRKGTNEVPPVRVVTVTL